MYDRGTSSGLGRVLVLSARLVQKTNSRLIVLHDGLSAKLLNPKTETLDKQVF